MIGMEELYVLVNNDIARKDHAGYTSTDEFNRATNVIQGILMDYYLEVNDARAREALRPFITETKIQAASTNYYNLPDDYRQKLDVGFETVYNNGCDPTFEIITANFLDFDEELEHKASVIRSRKKAYTFIGNQIKTVFPADISGRVYLKYYRNPTDAERGYSINSSTDEEEYNSASTTDLEWNQAEKSNFVDLHLLFKGISVRNTGLVQWVMTKQQLPLKTAVND